MHIKIVTVGVHLVAPLAITDNRNSNGIAEAEKHKEDQHQPIYGKNPPILGANDSGLDENETGLGNLGIEVRHADTGSIQKFVES